jgi:hypothetical protein
MEIKYYNFAMVPENYQPSGYVNFSRMEDYEIRLDFDVIPSHITSEYTTHPLKHNPFTFLTNVLTKMTIKNIVKIVIEIMWP